MESLLNFFHPSIESIWIWFITLVVSVIIAVLITNIIIKIFLAILTKRVENKYGLETSFGYVLYQFYKNIYNPLRFSSWLIGLWIVLKLSSSVISASISVNLDITKVITIIQLIIVSIFIKTAFKLASIFKFHFRKVFTRTDGGYNDFSTINALHRVSQVVIVIVSFFIIMGILDIPIASLAFLSTAILGFVAFSQQELIKNVFGGVVLYFDQPFSEGDWITAMDGSFQGTVEKISFRITKFIGFDSRPFYIPNSTFLAKGIVNNNRMTNRRILQYIGLRYEDFPKVEAILSSMKKYLKEHPRISDKKTTLVNMVNGSTKMGSTIEGAYGSYSINIMIYTFTNQTAWVEFQNIQDEIMLGLGKIVLEHGAQMAFPTQTLDFPADEFAHALSDQNKA